MGSLFEKIDEENTHDAREGSEEIGGAIAENYVKVIQTNLYVHSRKLQKSTLYFNDYLVVFIKTVSSDTPFACLPISSNSNFAV